MSDHPGRTHGIDLRFIAEATAVVLAMATAAAVAYLLLDILLLFFVGIVLAAALQPWHVALGRWGVPKGLAVLLIYLVILVSLVLMALIIGPVLIEQIGRFTSEAPESYANVRSWLRNSGNGPLEFLGARIPTFERLAPALADLSPQLLRGTLGVTTSIVLLPGYFVTVLAIAFYWTMEVPRFERLILSLIAVERRPRALNAWHEIEAKLGGFIRGQGLAMLFIAGVSAAGYMLIGLPNVLALGVLAGLLEAVPWIGPVLAVGPALLIALPMGPDKAGLVIGLAFVLQVLENNVLIPRIMNRSVGVSALVSLLAILAFGTLYGILGVLIAIPMAAVIQVLLDTLVVNVETVATPDDLVASPWDDLRLRIGSLRQRARARLRARASRMGIDPDTDDHVVDALDQQIETAVARVEKLIEATARNPELFDAKAQATIVDKVLGGVAEVEQAVERIDAIETPEQETVAESLAEATQNFEDAVEESENIVVAAQAANVPASGS